eukprot:gene6083-8382_t
MTEEDDTILTDNNYDEKNSYLMDPTMNDNEDPGSAMERVNNLESSLWTILKELYFYYDGRASLNSHKKMIFNYFIYDGFMETFTNFIKNYLFDVYDQQQNNKKEDNNNNPNQEAAASSLLPSSSTVLVVETIITFKINEEIYRREFIDFIGFAVVQISLKQILYTKQHKLSTNEANIKLGEVLKNWKNETPLHMAVHKRRLDTITLLLGNGADFTIKSKDDETALDIANKNDILGLILVLLSEYHQQQSTIDKGGNHSFSHQPPFANFLSSNPNATKLKNNDGNLPLHLAINGKSSFETIQFILSSYPEALKIKNNEGNLPLHLASNGKSSFETIQFILASYPEAIEIKNNEGNLPLHLASNGKLSFETIQFILSSYLEALKIKNNEGNLPDVDNKTFKNSLGDQMLDKQIPIDKSKVMYVF